MKKENESWNNNTFDFLVQRDTYNKDDKSEILTFPLAY